MNAFLFYIEIMHQNILGILHIEEVTFVDYRSHLFTLEIDCINFSHFIF